MHPAGIRSHARGAVHSPSARSCSSTGRSLFPFQKEQLSLLDGRTSMQCIEAVDDRAVAALLSSLSSTRALADVR